MDNKKPEIDVISEKPVEKKKKDYLRYILAVILIGAAAVIYIKDLRENRAIQEDLNFIHYLVSEQNVVNHIDMMIDNDEDDSVGVILRCDDEEVKAICEALGRAEPEKSDFLEEEHEGKLFTFYLNCNSNEVYCVEAAVVSSKPENAYVRAHRPVLITDEEGNKKNSMVYTRPAVIKGFGSYLTNLYNVKLPMINAYMENPNTQNISGQIGSDQKILIFTDQDQIKGMLQKGQAPATEAPATEAPATEASAVEAEVGI